MQMPLTNAEPSSSANAGVRQPSHESSHQCFGPLSLFRAKCKAAAPQILRPTNNDLENLRARAASSSNRGNFRPVFQFECVESPFPVFHFIYLVETHVPWRENACGPGFIGLQESERCPPSCPDRRKPPLRRRGSAGFQWSLEFSFPSGAFLSEKAICDLNTLPTVSVSFYPPFKMSARPRWGKPSISIAPVGGLQFVTVTRFPRFTNPPSTF